MSLISEVSPVICQSFDDFDQYAEILTKNQWDIDITQLDRGEFKADLVRFSLGPFRINHSKIDRSCLVRGQVQAEGAVFGFPVAMKSTGSWMSKALGLDTVQSYAPSTDYEAVTPASFETITCSVLPNYFDTATDCEEFAGYPLGSDVSVSINCGQELKNHFISKVFQLLNQFQHNPEYLENKSCTSDYSEDISALLYQIACSKNKPVRVSRGNTRNAVVARALEYLDSMQGQPVTVQELRKHANASRSTLERAFWDQYGVTPKSYLTALRLNGARTMLKNPDSQACKISDVAGRWGFWHMSQFSVDYRCQFGELPSETLNRALRTRPI
jgi:AraC family ethanolamine operon transcriptional activator